MSTWFSPAKINLYLAVTGVRVDGFHSIESLVARLDFGDTLEVTVDEQDQYSCNHPDLSFDTSNLLYRALQLYRTRTGFQQALRIHLEKRIPLGSGLGGGSSNASTLLQAVNTLNPAPVDCKDLATWSLELGSDCPLFFGRGSVLKVSGRGECIDPFPLAADSALPGARVLLIHPGFPITAAWAYSTLRSQFTGNYADLRTVDQELALWTQEPTPWLSCHRNDLSIPVDAKYLAIRSLKRRIKEEMNLVLMMSGSGSTCFLYLTDEVDRTGVEMLVRSCWGDMTWVQTAVLS